MNKELFEFLNTDLQFIKGVGPVLAARFDDLLGGRRVLDFMLHTPAYIRARGITDNVAAAAVGDVITIPLLVKSHRSGAFSADIGGQRKLFVMTKWVIRL